MCGTFEKKKIKQNIQVNSLKKHIGMCKHICMFICVHTLIFVLKKVSFRCLFDNVPHH